MIQVRPSNERGFVDMGWLKSYHSFSFGHYYDPKHVQFRALRVINEDFIAPKGGFPTHPHNDMEIVTYPLSGSLAHKDSLGNGSTITAGEVQRMSAGTGIQHSEFNGSDALPVHLLQIWLHTAEPGREPEYEQKAFDPAQRHNRLHLVVSPDGRDGSVTVHQDAFMYASELEEGHSLNYHPGPDRYVWLQVIEGSLTANGLTLQQGDGAGISGEKSLSLNAAANTHFLLFDLA